MGVKEWFPRTAHYFPEGTHQVSQYEQSSKRKQGSTKAYNGEIGYHPIFASWDEAAELLFAHLCRGSAPPESKFAWFMSQTLKRVPAGAKRKWRADSAFYARGVVGFCEACVPVGNCS